MKSKIFEELKKLDMMEDTVDMSNIDNVTSHMDYIAELLNPFMKTAREHLSLRELHDYIRAIGKVASSQIMTLHPSPSMNLAFELRELVYSEFVQVYVLNVIKIVLLLYEAEIKAQELASSAQENPLLQWVLAEPPQESHPTEPHSVPQPGELPATSERSESSPSEDQPSPLPPEA
jgi:hypothetical protein